MKIKNLNEALVTYIGAKEPGEKFSIDQVRRFVNQYIPIYNAQLQEVEPLVDDREGWEDYRQELSDKGMWPPETAQELVDAYVRNIKLIQRQERDIINKAEKKYGREFTSLEEIPEGKKERATINSRITSFRQLDSDNKSVTLANNIFYEYVDSLKDSWEDSIDGVSSIEEALSLFIIRGNKAFLPKETTLDYAGSDNYYWWYYINKSSIKIGILVEGNIKDSFSESFDGNRFMLLSKIFAQYPDLSSEDEDYLNQLSSDELISEIKNRGWDEILLDESLNDVMDPEPIQSMKELLDNGVGTFKLEKDLFYDNVENLLPDNWDAVIDGIDSEEELLSIFKVIDNGLYLPQGTELEYVGGDSNDAYYKIIGTDIIFSVLNDSSMYESLNEYWDRVEDTPYFKVASKSVMDSDGFWTDYTMYYNEDEDNYFFIFGDSDLYGPDPDYADWECDTNDEAVEWYNNYNGFEDEEDIEESLEFTRDELISKFGTDNVDLINAGREEERRVSLKEPSNVFEESSEFDARPGQEVTFSTEGMTEIPDVNYHFRVGPLTGTCIERTNDSVKMRVEGNSFLHEKLTISEDLFDDVELPAASPDPEIPEVAVESEPSKETPDQGPEFGIADLLNNLISSNWNLNSSYSELIVNAESNNMSDIANIVKDISAEVNNHIGKLQAALATICPSVENISVGEEEATQQLEQQSEQITEDISPEEKVSLEKRGTISQKTRNKLNKIVSKYNGYHEPAEIRNMWEELMNENVEVEMISGYGQQAADGGRSWTVGWSLEGIPVMNSMFVYAVYEPQDSTRNEYTIYFS